MDEAQKEGYAIGRSRMVSLCSVYKGKHHKVERNPLKNVWILYFYPESFPNLYSLESKKQTKQNKSGFLKQYTFKMTQTGENWFSP